MFWEEILEKIFCRGILFLRKRTDDTPWGWYFVRARLFSGKYFARKKKIPESLHRCFFP